MGLTIEDGRSTAHQGDLTFDVLKKIIMNSLYNTSYGTWNTANKTITITNGAHLGGTHYLNGEPYNYYFDVTVSGEHGRIWHSLLVAPANGFSNVVANV